MLIRDDSIAVRLIFAVLTSLGMLLLLTTMSPYRLTEDNFLAISGSFLLTLCYLGAFLVKVSA